LDWRTVPGDAVSPALIVDDPDAPGGTFTHWLAWGIDPSRGQLADGERPPCEGRNDFGVVGFRGPCPRRGRGPYRYLFRLYALSTPVAVRSGAGRRDLERAAGANILAVAELSGTYQR
jgi:Raf kinase inhibitor-like YbhB/YbcL family protein